MTADLLTLEDIATMHHCSIRHARDVLVKLPGFPAAAYLSISESMLESLSYRGEAPKPRKLSAGRSAWLVRFAGKKSTPSSWR